MERANQSLDSDDDALLSYYLLMVAMPMFSMCTCTSDLAPSYLPQSSFMKVGNQKCCITAICWTAPCPIYSGIAIACVKRCKTEMFLNLAAWVNSENHLRCLKGYPSFTGNYVWKRLYISLFVHTYLGLWIGTFFQVKFRKIKKCFLICHTYSVNKRQTIQMWRKQTKQQTKEVHFFH